jgi:hypothetical protein
MRGDDNPLSLYYRMGESDDRGLSASPEVNVIAQRSGDADAVSKFFEAPAAEGATASRFYSRGVAVMQWSVGGPRPATDLAYRWLTTDLQIVGLLPRFGFHDPGY